MTSNDQLGFVVGELYRGGYFCQLEKMSRVIFFINVKAESMNHRKERAAALSRLKRVEYWIFIKGRPTDNWLE